ncbi:MAG: 2-oxo acid dehydrogenase subunit E2, partial [Rectinema sp.]|nr:2-oxo acid dehydrogenase subunit E2 [Rectinema sp.]
VQPPDSEHASPQADTRADRGDSQRETTHLYASPRARRAMEKFNVAAAGIAHCSGPHGRIMEKDVLAARAAPEWQPEAEHAALARTIPQDSEAEEYRDVPLAGIRARIAARMIASLRNHAQYTLHTSANAERLLALRSRLKASPIPEQAGITIGDLVMYAVVRLLPEFPEFNATLHEGTLRIWKPVHLGVAVDTPRGLMVPVVRNASIRSLIELSKEVKRLAAACQNGTIEPDLLAGSTFTVTNLGAYGIERFTPVLNSPETAILGVFAIQPALVQEDNRTRTQMRLGLSLTADHQVIDGAYGARFLQRLAAIIADIDSLFLAFEARI